MFVASDNNNYWQCFDSVPVSDAEDLCGIGAERQARLHSRAGTEADAKLGLPLCPTRHWTTGHQCMKQHEKEQEQIIHRYVFLDGGATWRNNSKWMVLNIWRSWWDLRLYFCLPGLKLGSRVLIQQSRSPMVQWTNEHPQCTCPCRWPIASR